MTKINFGSFKKNEETVPTNPNQVQENVPTKTKLGKTTKSSNDKENNTTIHKLTPENFFRFFFMKKGNRAKKYEHYWFFFDPSNIDTNDKIDQLYKKYLKQQLVTKNENNWYSPTKTLNEILQLIKKVEI